MTLTNYPPDPLLDLSPWVGQRQCTYRFELFDGTTGINKGAIKPLRTATLSHDTTQTIKRTLNLTLGVAAVRRIDPVVDRIRLKMVFPGRQEYALGTYMFTDDTLQVSTGGNLSNAVLNDQNFIVDQEIAAGIGNVAVYNSRAEGGSSGALDSTNWGQPVSIMIQKVLEEVNVQASIENSGFFSVQAWGAGTRRGSIIEALAVSGDYFSPWFDHNNTMRFIRSFNPALKIPDFDWDSGNQVLRNSAVISSNILTAPNRFVVIGNTGQAPGATGEMVGVATVPPGAPNSFERRGFYISETIQQQVTSTEQCVAIARNLAERRSTFETVNISTAPDPRHDSYNVIHWRGSNWLETAWSLNLTEGGVMTHQLRRSYR